MKSESFIRVLLLAGLCTALAATATAQGLGGAGTVQGVVKDATGGVLPGAPSRSENAVSGFKRDRVD